MSDSVRSPQRGAQRPKQRRVIYTIGNLFDVDLSQKPDDVEYCWKVQTVAGQDANQNKIVAERNGWTPVPASRHPELAGSNPEDPDGPIIIGGQMLMEQPKEWAQEARLLDEFTARNTLEEKVQQLGLSNRRQGLNERAVGRRLGGVPELIE
jgi:hypothetical protein